MRVNIAFLFNKLSDADWEAWKRNCAALKWIVANREGNKRAAKAPPYVQAAIDSTIGKMRLDLRYPAELLLQPVNAQGQQPRYADAERLTAFDDVETMWQLVFADALVPQFIRIPGVCPRCGSVMPSTPKSKRPSRRKLCQGCSTATWREDNPDKYKKQQRKIMRERRAKAKAKKAAPVKRSTRKK